MAFYVFLLKTIKILELTLQYVFLFFKCNLEYYTIRRTPFLSCRANTTRFRLGDYALKGFPVMISILGIGAIFEITNIFFLFFFFCVKTDDN